MTDPNDTHHDASGDVGRKHRVLLIHAYPLPQSIATLIDIARDRIAAGAVVDAYDAFPAIAGYAPDIRARQRFLERIARKYRRFVLPAINGRDRTDDIDLSHVSIPPLPETIAELRGATAYGAKVGMAALSSAASFAKIAARERTADYGAAIQTAWTVAHRAAAAASQLGRDYDEVHIYNGRLCDTRPFCDILEETGTVYRYEMGSIPNSYVFYPGMFHDPGNMAHRMSEHEVNTAAGVDYFERRRGRKPGTDAHRFTDAQTRGMLPPGLPDTPLVAMFTSSEDEFFAIKDVASFGAFKTQQEVAEAIAAICRRHGKTLVLRLHPHLAIKSDYWKTEWDFGRLDELGVRIILPDEPIDSYALLEASETIVTCGSTIGVEAAFMERPSLMIGEHCATALGICPSALTESQIEAFVRAPYVLPRGREQAIRMGSYYQTAGLVIPGLAHGETPGLARFDGRIVDLPRYLLNSVRMKQTR